MLVTFAYLLSTPLGLFWGFSSGGWWYGAEIELDDPPSPVLGGGLRSKAWPVPWSFREEHQYHYISALICISRIVRARHRAREWVSAVEKNAEDITQGPYSCSSVAKGLKTIFRCRTLGCVLSKSTLTESLRLHFCSSNAKMRPQYNAWLLQTLDVRIPEKG